MSLLPEFCMSPPEAGHAAQDARRQIRTGKILARDVRQFRLRPGHHLERHLRQSPAPVGLFPIVVLKQDIALDNCSIN